MLFSPCVVTARALTARSVLDQPLARRHRIDARRVRELAGVARCGDLGIRRVLELPALADLSTTTAPQLRLPDGAGWRLGQALGHALEQGVRLWLCEVAAEAVPLITRTIGDGLVHVVSLPGPIAEGAEPDDAGAPAAVNPDPVLAAVPAPPAPGAVPAPPAPGAVPAPAEAVVIAVSPLALLLALTDDGDDSRRYLRTVLAGVDTLRCSSRAIGALQRSGVEVVPRSRTLRMLWNPVALAYLVVFVYSSLRAVPVAFVPGFHGRIWVLWTIDVLTAIPYTWGLVEMVAGRRIRYRLLGLLTTLVTFLAPYAYFWTKGRNYPPEVIAVVVAMIVGSAGLEALRWWREQLIVRGLAQTCGGRGLSPATAEDPRPGRSAARRRRGARRRSARTGPPPPADAPDAPARAGARGARRGARRWWRSIRPPRQC